MWLLSSSFVSLHYVYITLTTLLALVVFCPYGNVSPIDALFFGASASTESGLTTVDVSQLTALQQLYLYVIPTITNLGFINILVVVVRLYWFDRHLTRVAPTLLGERRPLLSSREERDDPQPSPDPEPGPEQEFTELEQESSSANEAPPSMPEPPARPLHIAFDPSADHHPRNRMALYIPPPRDRDRGDPIVETVQKDDYNDADADSIDGRPRSRMSVETAESGRSNLHLRRRTSHGPPLSAARSIERVTEAATSVFVLGAGPTTTGQRRSPSAPPARPASVDLPSLSRQATAGRNSQFYNLTARDRELLGGIEYRSLKLLLKITTGYFFGLHLLGAICLIGWVQTADPKYTDYLASLGQGRIWWAVYSAQTMVNNLGLTLTPDSMVAFRDAAFPLTVMTFLAVAGNTLYPVILRLVIWVTARILPDDADVQEPLAFLLIHPRRCYTLLFPSRPTWILLAIILLLNAVDALLIVALDLRNAEVVADLPAGPRRLLAAVFQAVSSRQTGTAVFHLARVNPAVQLSLLVMMYIAVFPIALSIRASNTYEERSLGLYTSPADPDDAVDGTTYLAVHAKNQLSFDLWYIFLGAFCICVAEADRIADVEDPALSIFSVLFEVTSAYANVGLSLGYPTTATSLSGVCSPFSRLVICFMMIRGRHRGLPYAIDRAIMLPDERRDEAASEERLA